MDISSLYNVSSDILSSAIESSKTDTSLQTDTDDGAFASILDSAVENINQANAYISMAEDEELKLAMGETENTHDLTNALQKASAAIQYTVAVRDKFIEAYRTIMNMQI